jgi:predicted metal-dependent peptidase
MIPDVLLAARLKLSRQRPYLGAALWALQLRPVKDLAKTAPGSMAVDKWFRLYFDPDVVAGEPVEELVASLVHEVGHLLREHADRADRYGVPHDGGHRLVWNVAGDAEINDDIPADGMRLYKGAVTPKKLKMKDGLFAEEYYARLMEQAQPCDGACAGQRHIHLPGKPETGCGSGSGGEQGAHEEGPNGGHDTSAGVGRVEAELIRQQVAEAVRAHVKSRGTVPGWMQRWADERCRSRVNWRATLAARVRRACADVAGVSDYSYARPSRRAAAHPGIVLPALRQPVPRVSIIVDTSGSMSEPELAQALAEIDGVLLAIGLKDGVTVLACDAAVTAVKRVCSKRDVSLAGGGGTDMRVGIERALAGVPRPDVVIVVTDCATPWPTVAPGVPVIVASTQRGAVVPGWATLVEVVPEVAA